MKTARDKLAIWRQLTTVPVHNESFMRIIIDIPYISTEEVIDRYMRGLKPHISKELCTTNYESLTKLMSHALNVESSKASFTRVFTSNSDQTQHVPMDISNSRVRFNQREKDKKSGSCYTCHTKGCHSRICPNENTNDQVHVSNLAIAENQGNGHSQ